jgi:NADPH:quinone reductase-like Zn-dependent oxidoreductase
VQIARAFGLRVAGVASEGKKDLVESLGAVHVPSGPGWTDRARALTPDGIDGIYDLVGGEVLTEAASLRTGGAALVTAAAPPGEAERLGGARVARAYDNAVLEQVADLVARGDLDPLVTRTFPLEKAGEALRAVEEGHARGKIVIEVAA